MTSTLKMMRHKDSGIRLYTKEAAISVLGVFIRSIYMAAANRSPAPLSAEAAKEMAKVAKEMYEKSPYPPTRGGKVFCVAGLLIFASAYLILVQWFEDWLPTLHIGVDPGGMAKLADFAIVGAACTAIAILVLYGILTVWLAILWAALCFISMGIYVTEAAHRPTHSLRWLMFAVFLFGFHFDLLLS
jgi:hypothetical protein